MAITAKGALKTVFTLGAIGAVATAGGFILGPFAAAAAGKAAAAAHATNGLVLGSFHAPLFTDVAGNAGVFAGLPKMGVGAVALLKAAWAEVAAGASALTHGQSVFSALSNTLHAPLGMAVAG